MPESSALSLELEILYRGQPCQNVPEYAELECRLSNTGSTPLEGLSLWLGATRLREGLALKPGGSFATSGTVGDLVGQLKVAVRAAAGPLLETTLGVLPQKLSLDEVNWIKVERLPTLLARLDAPNSLTLTAADRAEDLPFEWVSADYTAERLRPVCRRLLDEGLVSALLNRLDFETENHPRRDEGFVPGNVRWGATVRNWANNPAETGLVHEWADTPRNYATLPNMLLVAFLTDLAAEVRSLVRLVREGAPASARLVQSLPAFEVWADALARASNTKILQAVKPWPGAKAAQPGSGEAGSWARLEGACLQAKNKAYGALAALWQEYRRRYVRLPVEDERVRQVGSQPMSKVYELWAACEVAQALGLTFGDGPGLESATFQGAAGKLYYNQGASGGWYSIRRRQPARPDLRLELEDGSRVLLDVKYRTQESQAHPDDMYRMLAYMNDFGVARGGIIFPGKVAQALTLLEGPSGSGQRLAELVLRPPQVETLEAWQVALAANLRLFVS